MNGSFLEDLNRQRQRRRQCGFQKREIYNMLPFFKVFHEAQLLTKSSCICPKERQNQEDEERKDQETKTRLLHPIKYSFSIHLLKNHVTELSNLVHSTMLF